MKQLKILIVGLVMLILPFLLWTEMAQAHSFRTGTNVAVGQAERVNSTLFIAGRNIDIAGEVFGDVFCAGQTVTVSGTVHGDVICAGQTVHVSGVVDGDVRLAGQTVTVAAKVAGNATVGGQTFILQSSGSIGGDITLGTADTTINGPVGRDVAVGGETVIIANNVGRNIKGSVVNLRLVNGAHVRGDIEFTSDNDLEKSEQAIVDGTVTRQDQLEQTSKRGAVFGFNIVWFAYLFIAMLLTAMVVARLFPRQLNEVSEATMSKPWKALLSGFLASIAVPVLMVVLAFTAVGIPLAILVGLLWLVACFLSGPFFGYYLGRLVLKEESRPLIIMLVGASLLLLTYFIPILGLIILFVSFWMGTGMLVLKAIKHTFRSADAAKIKTKTAVAKKK